MNSGNAPFSVHWHTEIGDVYEDVEYQKVLATIQGLWNSGIIQRGSGHCHAMSDIIHKMLSYIGIESYLQECSLMILKKNPPELHMVGYSVTETKNNISDIKTHIVCVTKTKIPLLIDLSISNFIEGVPYICEPLKSENPNNLSDYEFDNAYFKYSLKSDSQIPMLHQQSILDRINTDKKIFLSIERINKVLMIIITLVFLNFVRGGYDFYAKYINQNNGFGPHKVQN